MNKHLVGVAAAVAVCLGGAVLPGSASASSTDPGLTGLTVGATLTDGVYDVPTGVVTQPFACHAYSAMSAQLSPISALVFSPIDGCVLQRRTVGSTDPWTTVAVAPGRTLLGPVNATGAVSDVPAGQFRVCYQATALYLDATSIKSPRACTDGSSGA